LQQKLQTAEQKVSALEEKLARAEGLIPRLEERCNGLGLEKRRLQERVGKLVGQVAELEAKVQVRNPALLASQASQIVVNGEWLVS
jgi:predicted nuclease with TOPRIM domain